LRFGLRFVGWGWTLFFIAILANELVQPPLWRRDSLLGLLTLWGHGGHEYLLMLCAINIPLGIFLILSARDPSSNRTFIDFAVVANGVHLTSMLAMAIADPAQHMNLVGDVPAGLLPTLVLGVLWLPVRRTQTRAMRQGALRPGEWAASGEWLT
jgi:hypothetical protein